jgi:hypothetical protein
MIQQVMPFARRRWWIVSKDDPRARRLADRHYSRQTPGADNFMPPARCLVLLTQEARAVWGVAENLDPAGALRWRCTIFRNEARELYLSSELVEEATRLTYTFWTRHYRGRPPVPLTTEIDPGQTRRKRDPGRCFRRAGWREIGLTPGGHGRPVLVLLEAPQP